MRYIARIPCTFGGKKFLIGNEIPIELVSNPDAQSKRGVIAIMKDVADYSDESVTNVADKVRVKIHLPDQDYEVSVTEDELNIFTDVLQMGVKTTDEKAKIAEIVSHIDSEDLLILMDAVDGRKVVKDAVKDRADALTAEPEIEPEIEPETPDTDGDNGEPETPPEE